MKTRTLAMIGLGGALFLGAAAVSAEVPAKGATATAPAAATTTTTKADEDRWNAAVDTLIDEYAGFYPSDATELGLHNHDGDLEDLSPAGRAQLISWLKGWEGKLAGFSPDKLPAASRFDLQLMRFAVNQRLFDARELGDERRLPALYLRLAAGSINVLIKRDFAPAEVRLSAVLSRQAKIPALLTMAEKNLDRMAPVSIDITLSDLDATQSFFTSDVTQAFPEIKDEKRLATLKKSCENVAAALKRFGDFLRKSRPQAKATYAMGAELYRKRLWADEMIDEPIDSLLQRATEELSRLQREFRKTAAKIDAAKPAAAIQLEIQKDHPIPSKIISETTARLANQQQFLVDKGLLTLPSPLLPAVKETPPFMRATSLASMDTAGPFENSPTAYYYVTLPEPSWKPEQTEDFLRGAYSRSLIDVVNIHEAFPGHYVQGLWQSGLTKARKVFGADSNVEGWAHYAEQMMLDENYGGGDSKLRLAQLQDALLRAARFVVALRMHAAAPGDAMTFEQAADFFNQEGFQTKKVSEMEAKRGTQDPMYLVYTYGKLEIYRLRKDVQAQRGAKFSLHQFHDDFLSYGRAPLKLIRKAMLGEK